MLKSQLRLKKNYQFKYTYKNGLSVFSKNLTLVFAKGTRKGIKIGFSVSNKIGKAVIRNRLKRQLRAAVAQHIGKFILGYNYIFVAKENILACEYSEIEAIICELLNKMSNKINNNDL